MKGINKIIEKIKDIFTISNEIRYFPLEIMLL